MVLPGPPPIMKQAGLRLMSCSIDANVIVRTASCTLGTALPVYSTFKAIEKKYPSEQEKWLLYWAAYGSYRIAEFLLDGYLSWFPLYHCLKFVVLIWLQFPSNDGAKHLYVRHLRPFLLRHQARLDLLLNYVSREIVNFISSHQEEIQCLTSLYWRAVLKVSVVTKAILNRIQPRRNGPIEGPNRTAAAQNPDSDSGHES